MNVMFSENEKVYCINCGVKTINLYKKYSETVLKLSECGECKQIADKYVEYDLVIVIIDLILFNIQAYRHILLNSEFRHFWKLSIVLVLIESYCQWVLSYHNLPILCNKINKTEPSLEEFDMNVEDIKFYMFSIKIGASFLCFVLSVYALTKLYEKFRDKNKNLEINFILVLKTMTLASTGIFLQLPSVIWDISLYSYHLHFITLYTCLSQLIASRVLSNGPKIWCLIVIFTSYYLKNKVDFLLGNIQDNFININS